MMKIAHICTSAISHKILADKLSILQNSGAEVHLISSPDGYDASYMEGYPLKLRFVPMNRKIHLWDDIISVRRLKKLMKRERYDIVHTHTAKAGLIGRVAAKLAGTPIILHTSHGLPFYDGQKRVTSFVYRNLEKLGAYFCDALSSQNREDLLKLKELAPGKPVYYEGNGVDLDKLDHLYRKISSDGMNLLRKQMNIPEGKRIILMAARLEPVKDHDFLLAGLHALKANFVHDFVCLLAGKGPLEAEIRMKIKELDLEKEVLMIGHQADIYPWIKMADIVALTSQKEGIPRFLMESMAFRKPAVASDVLGTRELVKHQETGLLVPYKQPEELALAFNELLRSPVLLEKLGHGARKAVEDEYTEEAVVARLHKMYTELEFAGSLKHKRITQHMKRAIDFTAAAVAIAALSPVFVLVALLIRTKMGSPVIFKQQRPGLHGKPFQIFKFRTMNDKRNEQGELLPDAKRLTFLGKLLRKTSLDELPQLFNVLRGEMSLIGPRPLLMEYLPLYTKEQQKRHWVRPGITGWAQVNGRNAISWDDKFKLDVWYTENMSLKLDLKIVWLTMKKVIRSEGVQQVGHATTTKFTGTQGLEGY